MPVFRRASLRNNSSPISRLEVAKSIILQPSFHSLEGAVEIAKTANWQNHSIRGFVSGHVIKKLGLKVESTKSEAGERTYRIVC